MNPTDRSYPDDYEPTFSEICEHIEHITVYEGPDGRLTHESGWPQYAAFAPFVIENTKDDRVRIEGRITITLDDGTATYAILGIHHGNLVCELAEDASS